MKDDWKDGESREAFTPSFQRVSVRHTGLEYVVRAAPDDAAVIGRGGKLRVALAAAGRTLERRT